MADFKKLAGSFTDPKKLFKLVRSPRSIIGMLGLTFAFSVFRFGATVIKSGGTRLWIAIAIVVIAIVLIVVSKKREKKKAKQIEDSLMLEADSLVMTSSGAQRTANERAREELAGAIESLKKTRGAGGANALSVLPWFLVLGKDGSGKSKMVRNSGLTFPGSGPSDSRNKGVGPGKNVSFWFTSQAIVLEASGRFVAREEDAESRNDWQGILEILRKARGEVALQGIVVAVSAEDLIRLDVGRLEEQARVLRKRLDATIGGLKAFIPVHLVVTKVDLIHGFEEFFADLTGNARDQALGATMDPEQVEEDPVRAFAREFEVLYRSLCDRRMVRMAQEERFERRGSIYLFPLEFASLRKKLRGFVKTLFEPSPYGERPLFRSFFFASGSLEGKPVEMVLNEVSRVIGLPADLDAETDVTRVIDMLPDPDVPSRAPARGRSDGEARFLREVFTRVLPTSAALARPTEAATRSRRLQKWGVLGGGVALAAVLAVLFLVSFARNRGAIASTIGLANEAALVPGSSATAGEVENRLRLLDPLRTHLEKLDAWDQGPPFTAGFGLYRAKAVNARARAVYMDRLAEVLLGPSRRALENHLFASYPASVTEYNPFFDKYRAYLMLIEPARADTTFLAAQLLGIWSAPAAGGGTSEGLRDLLQRHVAYAWRHPNDVAFQSAELPPRNPALVERAGHYIREFWRPENFYLAMIDQVSAAVPAFSIASVPGGSDVLASDGEAIAQNPDLAFVPGAFTLKGWRDEVSRRIAESETQMAEDWILKDAFQGQSLAMRQWLLDTYRQDYVARWAGFLGAVDIAPVPGAGPAATRLRDLAQPGSALVRLMESAASNLRFRGEGGDSLTAAALGTVEDDFAALHALFATQGEGAEARRPIDEYLRSLAGIVEALRQVVESGDPGLTSALYAKQMLADPPPIDAPIPTSIRVADRHCADILTGREECASALRRLLHRPGQAAWGALIRESQLYLDAAWGTSVWEPFRTLTGKYPFLKSGPDAPLEEFNRFFAPGGVFWTFHDGELAPFLDREGNPKVVWAHGLALSPEAQTTLRKAHAFREALFRETPGSLSFTYRIKPAQTMKVSGDPPFARTSLLGIGQDRVIYDMGLAKETRATWPGESQQGGARVSVTMDGSEPDPLVFEGPWALFRLMDRAQLEPRSESAYRVRWTLERKGSYAIDVPYDIYSATAVNPFARDFFAFDCPRQLGPMSGSAMAGSTTPGMGTP